MTINASDIKLLESERMSDASDGGGRRTSRVIVDGEPSNIFPKVSRLDSVYGRANIYKVYGAVVTANLDTYAGAHAAIMDRPDNDRIHINLFSTGSDYDTRTAARDRIESYVVSGPESRMTLYGRQLVGQQALLVYQREEEPLPEVGEVYCLSKEVDKVVQYQQFVRITDLTNEIRTFTDESGDFRRRVLALTIGAPLRYQFDGPDGPSRLSSIARSSLIRVTTVADAARYFGIKKLVTPGAQGDLTLSVESVYSPIVPTTQRETAVAMATISGALSFVRSGSLSATSPLVMSFFINRATVGNPYALNLPTAFRAGSLAGTLVINQLAGAEWTFSDNGDGTFAVKKYGTPDSGVVLTADYDSGTLYVESIYSNASLRWVLTVNAGEVGVYVGQPARTRQIEITLGNRGSVYSQVLNPLPAPGSTIVDYRALGKWYRLRDDGTGELLGGDTAYGAGTVDFSTGALVVTLGALPDVESSVLISWGSPVEYEAFSGESAVNDSAFVQSFTLETTPIQPGTLSLSFLSDDGAPYTNIFTATDSGGTGVISGNGVDGLVNYTTGEVRVRYTTRIPNAGSVVSVEYNKAVDPVAGEGTMVEGQMNTPGTTTLPKYPVAQSSFVMGIGVQSTGTMDSGGSAVPQFQGGANLFDSGDGRLILKGGTVLGSTWQNAIVRAASDTQVGTINYATGEVTISQTTIPATYKQYSPDGLEGGTWNGASTTAQIATGQSNFRYRVGGSVPEQTQTFAEISMLDNPLSLDLTKLMASTIIPGSVLVRVVMSDGRARAYSDKNGTLYTDSENGGLLPCGSIDYQSGIATLVTGYYEGLPSYSIKVQSLLTHIGDFSAIEAFFRTAGSPVRPGSFYVQATSKTGELLSGTSDASGNVTGPKVRGHIVQEMGVAAVEFGAMTVPSVGGAAVWTPIEIVPNTLRYSAVVLSNLPLNADILGLDPVRLPNDGRVPIYRAADVVVIHNTKTLELPNPLTAGSTHSMGRTALSEVWLTDADGKKVAPSKYAVNLDSGVLTMAADLDLTGTPQPLVAHHRIEEMQLLSDVQINGTIGLTSTLGRDFDADSYVSSALLFGDLNARYTNLFDQASWTSVWSNTLIGNGATAQYNDIDYPVEVLNDGAVTDRWRINFTTGNPSTGTASFQVISENLGVIATGNTGTDCAPVNSLTGKPYFVIRAAGWGIGWSVGNQVRFNTVAAAAPIWIARTVLPGATLAGDSFMLQLRGDVDA